MIADIVYSATLKHDLHMWRYLLIIPLAAVLGSLTAALIWAALIREIPTSGILRPIIGISVISMFFSLPGATMLAGFGAILLDRGYRRWSRNLLVLVTGAIAGFISLGLISGWDTQWSATGALFALTTASMLLIIEHLWIGASSFSLIPATILAVIGAILLGLATLVMSPL